MKLYVGNLSYTMTDEAVAELFADFGHVEEVQLITDRFSGESKGFGFVDMPNNSEADKAIKGLNSTKLNGRVITVNQAKPKTGRGGGRRR